MLNINIWEKYKKICKIGYGKYSEVYKVKNIKTREYYAIKQIEKKRIKGNEDKLLMEIKKIKEIKTRNTILIYEIINNKDFLYIVMDLCEYNLEDYLNQKRETPLSINEIKEVLNQLNNTFKIMQKEKIIHRDLKSSNILISLDKLDKNIVKLSDYG